MVWRSLGYAISQFFQFAGDVTIKSTQYAAQRKVEWLSTDYKRRKSFMNEPIQEFRKVVLYDVESNFQKLHSTAR